MESQYGIPPGEPGILAFVPIIQEMQKECKGKKNDSGMPPTSGSQNSKAGRIGYGRDRCRDGWPVAGTGVLRFRAENSEFDEFLLLTFIEINVTLGTEVCVFRTVFNHRRRENEVA